MKIRTRVKVGWVLTICVFLVYGALVLPMDRTMINLAQEVREVNEIVNKISILRSLTQDFLLYRTERAQRQWWAVYDEILRLLQNPECRMLDGASGLGDAPKKLQILGNTFSRLMTSQPTASPDNQRGEERTELQNRLTTQLLLASQDLISRFFNRTEEINRKLLQTQRLSNTLDILALSILGIVLISSAVFLQRAVIKPVLKLHAGTEIIGAGNLGYKVGLATPDEIGELSRAFDRMTANLQQVTVSRDDLAREVEERQRAEEALRQSEAQLRTIFDNLTEGVVVSTMDGQLSNWNRAALEMHGYSSLDEVRRPLAEFPDTFELATLVGEVLPIEQWPLSRILRGEQLRDFEVRVRHRRSGWERITNYSGALVRDQSGTPLLAVVSINDITERKRAENALRERAAEGELAIKILGLVNAPTSLQELTHGVTQLLQEWSGCEAVGIRLRQGEDFPYFETRGFPAEFVKLENSLCARDQAGELRRDSAGNPVIECMCGNVICGRFNPKLAFFTPGGSFWSNSTTRLLASTTDKDRQVHTRNRCNGEGYESVALVPLRSGQEALGLLQFNDRHQGRFTPEKIRLFEQIGDNLASGIARRLAEAEVKRLASFPQMNPSPVLEVDLSGAITFSNQAALEAVKKLGPEAELRQLIPEDLGEIIAAVRAENPAKVFYREIRIKDRVFGKNIYFVEPFQVVRIYSMDITERKRAEETLRQSEASLAEAQRMAHLGNWEWDITRNELTWSDEVYRIFGLAPQEFRPTHEDFLSFVHPEDLTALKQQVEEGFKFGKYGHYDYRIVRGDGSIRFVHSMGETCFDQAGQPLRLSGTVQDITERKQAEEKLRRTLEELERSNRELEQFAYISSHDLQEPLRKIANFSEMLAQQYRGQLDERAIRYFGYVTDGAKRMQALINDLLNYSRVGRAEFRLTPASLEEILQGTLNDLHALIKENRAEISHDPLPTLKVNSHQMGQLLQNLLTNAIKFRGDQPPQIHLSARQAGQEWVIAVRDNGIGFDSQYAEGIFQVFKRLHSKEKYPGTGIGLAICKKIVERHGGRIWTESEPGQGATFYFTIPA